MNLKKLTAVMLCVTIAVQALLIPSAAASYDSIYDIKERILTDALMNDSETLDAIKDFGRTIAIVSVSDGNKKAKVCYGSTASFEESLNKAFQKARASGMKPTWMRLDVAVSRETITYDEFKEAYSGSHTGFMRSCIGFNNYYGTILTEAQIQAGGMIDTETGELDLKKVNKALSAMGKKQLSSIPDKLYLFKTQGYFTDNSSFAYKLMNGTYQSVGRRGVQMTREYIENLAAKSSAYLANICNEKGKFIYGYYPIDNEEIEGYNIIRHAGTVWNLIMQYEMTQNAELIPVIERALNYLTSRVQYKNETTGFISDGKSLSIGAGGLSLIAYCQYAETFGSNKYNKVIEALANGVMYMQKDDGSFTHSLKTDDYKVDSDYIIIYYDGEAMYGLAKAYGVLRRSKYLNAAKSAADYFIENEYETEHSHWIMYAFNELTKYSTSIKYFEFGLKNAGSDGHLKKAYNTVTYAHTTNETLGAAFELYDRLMTSGRKCGYLEEFDAQTLIKAFRRRTAYGQNYFMFPEYAMYFESPQTVVNSFAVREDLFRIRIDDIQHFMDGYYLYWKNYDRLSKYEKASDN